MRARSLRVPVLAPLMRPVRMNRAAGVLGYGENPVITIYNNSPQPIRVRFYYMMAQQQSAQAADTLPVSGNLLVQSIPASAVEGGVPIQPGRFVQLLRPKYLNGQVDRTIVAAKGLYSDMAPLMQSFTLDKLTPDKYLSTQYVGGVNNKIQFR